MLDCHDRECLAWIAVPRDLNARNIQQLMHDAVTRRFGATGRPDAPIQLLSDNGSIYTALDTICTAERLHLVTTPLRLIRRSAFGHHTSTGPKCSTWFSGLAQSVSPTGAHSTDRKDQETWNGL